MADLRSGGEVSDRSGMLIAPADVAGDRGVLFVVAAVVGAVEREVPQRGEFALGG